MKKKVANILSTIVASLFIAIGLLHTEVHFRELNSSNVKSALVEIKDVQLLGEEADMWRLWQGFSFMMGICFVIIGVLRIITMQAQGLKYQLVGAFAMVVLLVVVIVSGKLFFGPVQTYGGSVGLALQCYSIFLLLRKSRKEPQ
ncbi:MAG: hypothetical protein AAF616_05545 [Bacteroidota bacterium]